MNEATADQPNEVASEVVDRAEVRDGKAIVRYDRTAAALADLRARFTGAIFDCATVVGDKAARAARQELVSLRTSLDRKRGEFKAPALAFGKAIDSEAKRLEAEIRALEEPIDAQIRADEARREADKRVRAEAEAKRIETIQHHMEGIREGLQDAMMSKTAADVQHEIDHRLGFGPPKRERFDEFYDQAAALYEQTIAGMRRVLAQRVEQEAEAARIAVERAELERLRAEAAARDQAERERIAAEQRAEAERLAAERRRLEAEQAEAVAERARLDAEAAATRRAAEAQAAAARAEADRFAREVRETEERELAAARAELQRQQEAAAAERQRQETAAAAARRAQEEAAAAERERQHAADDRVRRAAPQLLTALRAYVIYDIYINGENGDPEDGGRLAGGKAAIALAMTELPSFTEDDIPF